ncbi:DUF2283 domain-containing protein [Candidatus Bathyarchaeota archaeon]|nr:DUF2283 domain-containing protein [Candidatus Bathyarchaeota archaeon]
MSAVAFDARKVLEQLETKYGLTLPRKVITIDYDKDVGDLFIRFKNTEATEGEPTSDGKAIVHYDKNEKIVAVEITDVTAF